LRRQDAGSYEIEPCSRLALRLKTRPSVRIVHQTSSENTSGSLADSLTKLRIALGVQVPIMSERYGREALQGEHFRRA
jgi:hypothetical protein